MAFPNQSNGADQERMGGNDSVAREWTVTKLLEHCSRRPTDEYAWQEFVRRYHPTIKANVMKTFHKKARQEADRKQQFPEDLIDDLVQAVYMRLVEDRNRALKRFHGEHANSIYQYLAMISVNVVRDHFREAKAQKRPKISYSLDELVESGGDGIMMDQAISRIDGKPMAGSEVSATSEEIEKALRKSVSGKNRDRDILIFKLRYYEGLSLKEITRALNPSISAISVGSTLSRVIKKIKPLLELNEKGG